MAIPQPSPIPKLRIKLPDAPPQQTSDRVIQLATPRLRRFVEHHIKKHSGCQLCPLWESASRHVFYRGYVPADILFIGEAPGNSEDTVGRPLVGNSCEPMTRILEKIKDYHERAYGRKLLWCITNTVCCRPPVQGKAIRPPKASEANACNDRLVEFVKLVQPKVVVLLGQVAQRTWYANDNVFIEEFPPQDDWPSWAIGTYTPVMQAIAEITKEGSLFEKCSARLKYLRELEEQGQLRKPAVIEAVHPSWILRQPEDDQSTEINRSALAVIEHLESNPLYPRKA